LEEISGFCKILDISFNHVATNGSINDVKFLLWWKGVIRGATTTKLLACVGLLELQCAARSWCGEPQLSEPQLRTLC
jgi:hypothetical protein